MWQSGKEEGAMGMYSKSGKEEKEKENKSRAKKKIFVPLTGVEPTASVPQSHVYTTIPHHLILPQCNYAIGCIFLTISLAGGGQPCLFIFAGAIYAHDGHGA